MAVLCEQVNLAGYTTLRLGGPARRFVEATTEEDLISAVRAADAAGEPVLIIGGGSNLVVSDEGFPGTVVHVATRGVTVSAPPQTTGTTGTAGSAGGPVTGAATVTPGTVAPATAAPATAAGSAAAATGTTVPGGKVLVRAQAGEDWDPFVARCVDDGLAGVECLSGIPGKIGATPIQNVGAYGQEVSETIIEVRVLDRTTGRIAALDPAACAFTYRGSVFKGSDRYVVLDVTFRLTSSDESMPIRYAELARTLGVEPGDRVPLHDARTAVLELRGRKGMVIDPADPDTRSAGSFFTNPILDPGHLAELERRVTDRLGPETAFPRYPEADGRIKTSAAWLIDKAGFTKGHRRGHARISTKHTLALTNPGGASTAELLELAREVRDGVREVFGVELVNEPVLVGVRL